MADFCHRIRGFVFNYICPQAYAVWLRAFATFVALTKCLNRKRPHSPRL